MDGLAKPFDKLSRLLEYSRTKYCLQLSAFKFALLVHRMRSKKSIGTNFCRDNATIICDFLPVLYDDPTGKARLSRGRVGWMLSGVHRSNSTRVDGFSQSKI
jgi:hypothetical protein